MMDGILKNEERAILTLRGLYRRYGYAPYKMSRFEEYDLYVHNKDFLASDQIITFSGDRGRLLALKPDVTLSIVKNAPEAPGVVQKVYYNENVYRDYREIMQAGLEAVGDLTDYEIAEVVILAVKSLELLGNPHVLDISHVGLVSAVLSSCGLEAGQKTRAMELLRRKNAHELKTLCGENAAGWEKLEALLNCRKLEQLEAVLTEQTEKLALEELKKLWKILELSGCADAVRLDFSVGSDLRYYSGVVFRGYLAGIPTSILSGGQYDKLPQKMGRKARAIGFAIYVDLLQELHPEANGFQVDTLILHDGSVDTAVLTEAAAKASETGTVLVSRTIPTGRSYRQIIRYEKGARSE